MEPPFRFMPLDAYDNYDPSRVMPNGEMVYQAMTRLRRAAGGGDELRNQAMAMVRKLVRKGGKDLASAEDEVYCRMFGRDRFPVVEEVIEEPVADATVLPSLDGLFKSKRE